MASRDNEGVRQRETLPAEWIRRAREGDADAFGVVMASYERMVLRTSLRLLGRMDRAQDAAQETFLRLHRNLRRFDETRELGPWLYRIAVNVCRRRHLLANGMKRRPPMSRRRYRLWMMLTLLLAALPAAALAADDRDEPTPSQDAAPPPAQAEQPRRGTLPGDAQRVFVIQHIPVDELAHVLSVFPSDVAVSQRTKTLGITASPAVLAAIEETVARLDVPQTPEKSIDLTGYVLEALPEAPKSPAEALPKELEAVVLQLQSTFRYAGYRLVDALLARGRDGSGLQTNASDLSARGKAYYTLRVGRADILPGAAPLVRLKGVYFSATLPAVGDETGAASDEQARMQSVLTDVAIREGQHVVLGKSGTGKDGRAIILVLSAKILD